ncbi:gem-like protein 5 [Quercus suber]|uniref:Gem-like protein 5 n=1 Tax=Quercus suber TaxID=58331 RepID=A0AAW0JFF0_QUESU
MNNNNNTNTESRPLYPTLSAVPETNPFYEEESSSSSQKKQDTQPHELDPSSYSSPKKQDAQPHELAPSSSSPQPRDHENAEKWGTHVMGQPAIPTCHPDNKKAALWGAGDEAHNLHHPYLQFDPIEKSSNIKTNSSVHEAAWGKMNLTAKAITGGGFEAFYKQIFTTYPNEKLKKSFASYLSTSTGPVAGTLYLSNIHVAFCSDRPLSFTAPSGQETWSYYKVIVPLGKIGTINPVTMKDNPSEKYIQIVTVDGHDFWFMGFVNYDKASKNLSEGISNFVVSGIAVKPVDEGQKSDYHG